MFNEYRARFFDNPQEFTSNNPFGGKKNICIQSHLFCKISPFQRNPQRSFLGVRDYICHNLYIEALKPSNVSWFWGSKKKLSNVPWKGTILKRKWFIFQPSIFKKSLIPPTIHHPSHTFQGEKQLGPQPGVKALDKIYTHESKQQRNP